MTKNITVILTDADGLASFNDSAFLVLTLTRHEIERGNISSALERLHLIADTQESAMRYRESLVFMIWGYDDDPRELAEIPEVRAFFARLVQEWPHWLWFLARNMGAIALFMSLICTVKIHRSSGNSGTEFLNIPQMTQKLDDLFQRGNAMLDAYGISDEMARASAQSAVAELVPA